MTLENVLREAFPESQWEPDQELGLGSFPEWDSIGHFNFMLLVEEKWQIQFSLEELEEAKTLAKIKTFLERRGLEVSLR